jgi:hypothetical protein
MAGLVSKETLRIELPEGQWADVKKFLSYGDRRMIRASFLRTPNDMGTMETANAVLLFRAVVDWSVTLDGKKAPITRENIDELDEEKFVVPLLEKMNELYRPLDESQKKV